MCHLADTAEVTCHGQARIQNRDVLMSSHSKVAWKEKRAESMSGEVSSQDPKGLCRDHTGQTGQESSVIPAYTTFWFLTKEDGIREGRWWEVVGWEHLIQTGGAQVTLCLVQYPEDFTSLNSLLNHDLNLMTCDYSDNFYIWYDNFELLFLFFTVDSHTILLTGAESCLRDQYWTTGRGCGTQGGKSLTPSFYFILFLFPCSLSFPACLSCFNLKIYLGLCSRWKA